MYNPYMSFIGGIQMGEHKESGWDKWWRSTRSDSLWWAILFILGGVIVILEITNTVDSLSWWNGWSVFFTGMGIVTLLMVLIRYLIPNDQHSVFWGTLWGCILLSIGLGDLVSGWIWGLVLLAIGVGILKDAITKKSQTEND
jgi:hypothetical protein